MELWAIAGRARTPASSSAIRSTARLSKPIARSFHRPCPFMIPVLSPEQSNSWDRLAVTAAIELATLMESRPDARWPWSWRDRYPHLLRAGVLVAAGPGNNGGDGWVVARALHHVEVPVWVASAGPGSELRSEMARLARAEGVREVGPDGPWPAVGLAIDALLGTGASRATSCRTGRAARTPARSRGPRRCRSTVPPASTC